MSAELCLDVRDGAGGDESHIFQKASGPSLGASSPIHNFGNAGLEKQDGGLKKAPASLFWDAGAGSRRISDWDLVRGRMQPDASAGRGSVSAGNLSVESCVGGNVEEELGGAESFAGRDTEEESGDMSASPTNRQSGDLSTSLTLDSLAGPPETSSKPQGRAPDGDFTAEVSSSPPSPEQRSPNPYPDDFRAYTRKGVQNLRLQMEKLKPRQQASGPGAGDALLGTGRISRLLAHVQLDDLSIPKPPQSRHGGTLENGAGSASRLGAEGRLSFDESTAGEDGAGGKAAKRSLLSDETKKRIMQSLSVALGAKDSEDVDEGVGRVRDTIVKECEVKATTQDQRPTTSGKGPRVVYPYPTPTADSLLPRPHTCHDQSWDECRHAEGADDVSTTCFGSSHQGVRVFSGFERVEIGLMDDREQQDDVPGWMDKDAGDMVSHSLHSGKEPEKGGGGLKGSVGGGEGIRMKSKAQVAESLPQGVHEEEAGRESSGKLAGMTRGGLWGIGARIAMDKPYSVFSVSGVMLEDGGLPSREVVKAGDVIVAIDGQSTEVGVILRF